MSNHRKQLIRALLKGIETGDEAATAVVDPNKYIQHKPQTEAIVANRIPGIRFGVLWSEQNARLSKEHGNCNVITIGQRLLNEREAIPIFDTWLCAEFKDGRHQKRIDKIDI